MTWLTGSWTVDPGMTSSSVGSPSPAAPAGVAENDTYWFSGVCLLRVAVFTAVMIWRGVDSSAEVGKEEPPAGGEAPTALLRPGRAPLARAAGAPPGREEG